MKGAGRRKGRIAELVGRSDGDDGIVGGELVGYCSKMDSDAG